MVLLHVYLFIHSLLKDCQYFVTKNNSNEKYCFPDRPRTLDYDRKAKAKGEDDSDIGSIVNRKMRHEAGTEMTSHIGQLR
jgi:hypothetical protein